jgi:hypothetical protein
MQSLTLVRIACVFLLLGVFSQSAAQQDTGSIYSFAGTISNPNQRDAITLEVPEGTTALNSAGAIALLLIARAAPGSNVDPGLIDIEPHEGAQIHSVGVRRPDTALGSESMALVEVSTGQYEVLVRSEKRTTGAYTLDVYLVGDVNGDLVVDQHDIDLIRASSGAQTGTAGYVVAADTDRNGVINGGDLQRARRNLGAGVLAASENPLDQPLPDGALRIDGLDTKTFYPRSRSLSFTLAGAEFDRTAGDVHVTINGNSVPSAQLSISGDRIETSAYLVDGRNEVRLKAYDTVGRPLFLQETVWAGSAALSVTLVNPDGTPYRKQATVTVSLSDDPSVTATIVAEAGSASFPVVPNRTILVKARGEGNDLGFVGRVGPGSATIRMGGLNQPSAIKNLDFSQGTEGWLWSPFAQVSLIPHLEQIPGFSSNPIPSTKSSASSSNRDIRLMTRGQGEQSLTTTFSPDTQVAAVRVRYRFVTSEVPGGYFGSQFNDYFRVSVRSSTGGAAVEANTMNGLGLGAFDFASGSTNWREEVLHLDGATDVVQVDVAVANVGDGLYDSSVVVDLVEEIGGEVVPSLAWDNAAGGLALTYEVRDEALEEAVQVEVYWASGTSHSDRIGNAIFTTTVAAGTEPGSYGPFNIDGGLLQDNPDGFTHFIATSSPSMVGSLADVVINFGPNADRDAVSERAIDIVKDGLRAAGQPVATISSTARNAEDQARAMFNNLVNPANTIQVNITNQLALYGVHGDAVINVFANLTQGQTREQIMANARAIRDAMVDEINERGCENVTRHCADPTERTVMDVGASVFNQQNAVLFHASVLAQADRVIDERGNNNCFHIEVNNNP